MTVLIKYINHQTTCFIKILLIIIRKKTFLCINSCPYNETSSNVFKNKQRKQKISDNNSNNIINKQKQNNKNKTKRAHDLRTIKMIKHDTIVFGT